MSKTRLAQFNTALSTAQTLYTHGQALRKWHVNRTTFTATVPENSYVYPALMDWLNERVQGKQFKFISKYDGVKRFYDGEDTVNTTVKGFPITACIEVKEAGKGGGDDDYSSYMPQVSLLFTTRDRRAIDALEELLVELTNKHKSGSRKHSMYALTNYGWDSRNMPPRPISSVFLPEGVKESVIEDLETFLDSEDRYVHVGIPWHRGYMLYGEPGNGKSSMVAALANYKRLNLYNLTLSSITSDKHLLESVGRVEQNSILLIEDIDVFSSAKYREQGSEKGPTLAGLLNALDGVGTPHGLITFITTNHIEKLDSALVRPGRIDYRLELKSPDLYQIDTMFKHVYGEDLNTKPRAFKSMAELTNVFKTHPTSAEDARLEIKEA